MTIKKQFILLSSLLFVIPLLCIFFTFLHRFVWSSRRMVIKADKHTEREIKKHFTDDELKIIRKYFYNLPPEVDGVLLNKKKNSDDFIVVISSIKEYLPGDRVKIHEIWEIVQTQSEEYLYQFTSPKVDENEISIMITRMPKHRREVEEKRRGPDLVFNIIIFLFIIVLILLFLIILISRNIFHSISFLEKTSQDMAEGNINTEIKVGTEIYKPNEITNISQSLEKMRLSLVEAQNRKIKLIMGISHDLRTPVAVIKGYTEGLKDGVITDPAEIQNALTLIETKTNQLEEMIDTLINFTKMSTSEIRNTLSLNSITQFISEFFTDCSNSVEVFNRKMITDFQIKDDIIIPLDLQLVQRALLNLFNNALRYTNDNDTISLSAIQQEHQILLTIADTGIGISEEDLPHIFDLFYRGTASRREEGMGIGLSVVQNTINIHNWDIQVSSKVNEGTQFVITIPY